MSLSNLGNAINAIINDVVKPFLKSLAYTRPFGIVFHCKYELKTMDLYFLISSLFFVIIMYITLFIFFQLQG